MWNIGTGYFGCRDHDGNFSLERFRETASIEQVKMIELKFSQGSWPLLLLRPTVLQLTRRQEQNPGTAAFCPGRR